MTSRQHLRVSQKASTPWGGFLEKPPSKRMESVPSARNLVAKHPTDARARLASLGRFRKRPSDARLWKPSRGWCPLDTWLGVSDGQQENHQLDTSQSVRLMVFTRVQQSKKKGWLSKNKRGGWSMVEKPTKNAAWGLYMTLWRQWYAVYSRVVMSLVIDVMDGAGRTSRSGVWVLLSDGFLPPRASNPTIQWMVWPCHPASAKCKAHPMDAPCRAKVGWHLVHPFGWPNAIHHARWCRAPKS
jgi:hypothetical protein